MANFDEKIKIDTPSANVFRMPFRNRFTSYMGILCPCLHKEIVPGDRFKVSVSSLTRLAPMTNPVFDEVDIHYRAFFVPNRILDPKWKQFITAGEGLYGSQDAEIPPLTFDIHNQNLYSNAASHYDGGSEYWLTGVGSLADMLGIHYAKYVYAKANSANGSLTQVSGAPVLAWYVDDGASVNIISDAFTNIANNSSYADAEISVVSGSRELSLLPFLGYQKIYDDWYRNERFQTPITDSIYNALGSLRSYPFSGNSNDFLPFYLRSVNYHKDRYTTALPEPVIGGPVDAVPSISGDFPLLSDEPFNGSAISANDEGDFNYSVRATDNSASLFTRIADAAATTVQQLKFAFKAYSFFMKDTYNGNRYVEFIESHFDKRVPDSTLDRAIYLGSHKETISFGEVFQTSAGDGETSALGDYAGRGMSAGNGFLFDEEFLEHGQLYVLCSIVPRATYFQGIDRKFFKKDRFDYFFPEFQNIGDEALYNIELYHNGSIEESSTFGHQSRWVEYKESLDEVHGEFLTTMRSWHFAREFADMPVIGEKFSAVPQINNPFTVLTDWTENYMFDVRFDIEARRPLYYYEEF